MAEADDWQPVAAAEKDDWQPATPRNEPPLSEKGYMSRVAAGFVPDTIDMFKEGVHATVDAPGQILGVHAPTGHEELGVDIYNKMLSIGASEDQAKRESERMMRKLQRGQGIFGLFSGPLQAITSPLLGLFRSGVSRPVQEDTGFPMEATETLSMAALAALGMRPPKASVGRIRVNSAGEVSAQAIGDLPNAADFKASAEIIGGPHTEANLRSAWEQQGIHPSEAVNDAARDPFLRHDLKAEPKPLELDPDLFETFAETGGPARALGAEATTDPPPISMTELPPPPPATIMTRMHQAGQTLMDMGRDAQMLVAPMATGTTESMALAKDFANTLRRNRWEWSRIDDDVAKRFNAEQRKRMWDAADEESVLRQEMKDRPQPTPEELATMPAADAAEFLRRMRGEEEPIHEHMGLSTLEPAERAAVQDMQARAQAAWLRARDLGMVEGEGLPAYTPRMVINTAAALAEDKALPLNSMGANLRVRTAQMMHRKYLTAEETEAAAKAKYGDQAELARDIRTLPLATAKLEDAIAGRTLIDAIKDYGKRTGSETTVEGGIPAGTDQKWFTLDHPSFRTWRPKFEDGKAVTDAEGNTIFEQVPIYVRGDFEGPLRAVLSQKSGIVYNSMMALKGKTMSLIMNSPMIHNAVEWGRALPAMPGKVATFRIYFEGNRARKDVATMREAIDNGMVPIGHRFFNQDITSIMEQPNLAPGRSWTSQILGFVPGLFDEAAGAAVKRSIDKAGDFWHNTLLWDRVADLQAGLYTNFRDDLLAKGVDRQTAARAAAHWANRYAGALPQEAMSDAARKVANMLLFSRSFTMGNLGVLKDMFTGLPKDVLAQIERDGGFRPGSIAAAGTEAEAGATAGAEAVRYAKSMARRKAIAVVALDIGFMYIGNSLLQNAANVLVNDSTLDKEFHDYAVRFADMLKRTGEHPLSLLQPFHLMESLSATSTNEPDRKDRIKIGYAKDGTAIYARMPMGKIPEEFIGWMTGPLDMMRKKMGTLTRPAWQVMSNDQGFGRKIYDPDADTPQKYIGNAAAIAKHFAMSQLPEGQLAATRDLIKGEGDSKVNALQAAGPFAGVTFAKGSPGGPAVGELYHARTQHDFAVQAELPDIRKQILRGDIAGAQERMTALGIAPGLQRFYIRTSINPSTRLGGRTLRDFYLYGTEEQKDRLLNAR